MDINVGTWTLEDTTSWVMNSSRLGRGPSSCRTALAGGDPADADVCVGSAGGGGIMVGSQAMTLKAALAR